MKDAISPLSRASSQKPADRAPPTIAGATLGSHPTGDEFPDMNGSMIIYRVKNLEEAYELCRADPYAVEGVWDVDNAKVIPVRTNLASMGK
jgi:hypothetical protein